MIGTRKRVGLVFYSTLVAFLMIPVPVGAQLDPVPDPSPQTTTPAAQQTTMEVVSATPWVEADGEWTTQLRITGAPPDSVITYRIRQAVSGTEVARRAALTDIREGKSRTRALSALGSEPLSSVTDATGLATLTLPIRGEANGNDERIYVPDSGVFPVDITVESGGETLDRLTQYLNRLPNEADTRSPFALSLLVETDEADALDTTGAAEVTPALRSAVGTALSLLDQTSGLETTISLHPQEMLALSRSQLPADLDLLADLTAAVNASAVLRSPWASLHLEGWAASGDIDAVRWSLLDGQDTLFQALNQSTNAQVWRVDDSAGPQSVDLLKRVGVSTILVDGDHIVLDAAPTGETGFSQPFTLTGASGSSVSGLAIDAELTSLLAAPTDQPQLAAQQLTAVMFATWLVDQQGGRGAVIALNASTNQEVLGALAEYLRDPMSPLEVSFPDKFAEQDPATVGRGTSSETWSRKLITPSSIPDVTAVADLVNSARKLWTDLGAMLPPEDEEVFNYGVLIQQSMDRRVDPTEQADQLSEAINAMTNELGSVTASEPRSVTVTSREASIPLRFTNELDRPVTVRLLLQSPRLDFEDGSEQILILQPGLNRIDVQVNVLSSGQFTMQADILAPTSDRVLASTSQRIRSTTFSGVGLLLSGGALLFLVFWWSRTLRRKAGEGEDGDPDELGNTGESPASLSDDARLAEATDN